MTSRSYVGVLALLCSAPALPVSAQFALVPNHSPMSFVGNYAPTLSYSMGDTAIAGGVTYTSLRDGNVGNTPATSPSYWTMLAAPGQGALPATAVTLLNNAGQGGGVATLDSDSGKVPTNQLPTSLAADAALANAARAQAPHVAIMNSQYATASTCTWKRTVDSSGNQTITGGVDDYAAIQDAYSNAGSFDAPPVVDFDAGNHNAPQGTVVWPDGKTCASLSRTIVSPVGVLTQGNGAYFWYPHPYVGLYYQFGQDLNVPGITQVTIPLTPTIQNAGYGNYFAEVDNLHLIGPDQEVNGVITPTSLSPGLLFQMVNHGKVDGVTGHGSKYGFAATQMQYTKILNSHFSRNQVNCYVANDPSNLSLPSLDDEFRGTDCSNGERFGYFIQDGTQIRIRDGDAGFNKSADFLIGGQLPDYPYSASFSGGSGCPVSTSTQFSYADSSGSQTSLGRGFYQANASGIPFSVQITDGGLGIDNPVFTFAAACTGANPSIVFAGLRKDQTATGVASLGFYQGGHASVSHITVDGVKAESSVALGQYAPETGYAVSAGVPGQPLPAQLVFNNDNFVSDSSLAFMHQMRTYATGISVLNPVVSNGVSPGAASGSTTPADYGDYQTLLNGPNVFVQFTFNGGVKETNVGFQFVDGSGAATYNVRAAYTLMDSAFRIMAYGINIGGATFTPTVASGNGVNNYRVTTPATLVTPALANPNFTPTAYYGYDPTNNTISGTTWSDDTYLYHRSSGGHILRFPWRSMPGDTASSARVVVDGGTQALSGGTATIISGAATASSVIQLTNCASGGTVGQLSATRAAGTFTINSTSTSDTSTVCWSIYQ